MANTKLDDICLRDYEGKIEKLLRFNSVSGKRSLLSLYIGKDDFCDIARVIELCSSDLGRKYKKLMSKKIKTLFTSEEIRQSSWAVFMGETSNGQDICEMFKVKENFESYAKFLTIFEKELLAKILPSTHCKGVVAVSDEEIQHYILSSEKLDECGLIVLNGLSNEMKQQQLNKCFEGKEIDGCIIGFTPGCEWMKASFADAMRPLPCFNFSVQDSSKGEAEVMLTKTLIEDEYLLVRELKNIYEFFNVRNECQAMTRTGLQPSLEVFEDGSADVLLLHETVVGEVFVYNDSERKASRVLVIEPGMAMPAIPVEDGFQFSLSGRSDVRAWLMDRAERRKGKVSVTLVKNHMCRGQEVLALGGACDFGYHFSSHLKKKVKPGQEVSNEEDILIR